MLELPEWSVLWCTSAMFVICFAVRMLLDHNANPNQKDIIGNTALHLGELLERLVWVRLLK